MTTPTIVLGATGPRPCNTRREALLRLLLPIAAAVVAFVVVHHLSHHFPKTSDQVNAWQAGVDMATGNWRLTGWTLPVNTYWLEDDAFYAAGHFAWRTLGLDHEGPRLLVLMPALIWSAAVLAAAAMALSSTEAPAGKTRATALIVLLGLVGLPTTRAPAMFLVFLAPIHMATTLLLLLAFAAAAATAAASTGKARLAFATLSFVPLASAIASDPLALYVGTPALCLAALVAAPTGTRAILFTTPLLAAAAGLALPHLAALTRVPVATVFTRPADLPARVVASLRALALLWNGDPSARPIGAALPELAHWPLIAAATAALALSSTAFVPARRKAAARPPGFLDAALLAATVLDLAALSFSTQMRLDAGRLAAARYLFPAAFLGAVLAARRLAHSWVALLAGLLAIAGTTAATIASWHDRPEDLVDRQQALRAILEAHHATVGIGPYWVAAPMTLATGSAIRVYPGDALPAAGGRIVPNPWNTRPVPFPPLAGRDFVVVLADPPENYFPANVQATFGDTADRVATPGFVVWFYHCKDDPAAGCKDHAR